MVRLISFEGGDGSGKSTQLKLLADYLSTLGKTCLSTREPGGTPLGRMIRQVLVEVGHAEISFSTELFLYLADRAQHVQEVIEPALNEGKVVLCDRFTDSTLAYQGYGRGVALDMLRRLNALASRGVVPDMTLLLDCPVEIGLSRTAKRPTKAGVREDRFERERIDFHERVREGFLELARMEPRRIHIVDASRPVQEVHEEIKRIVDEKLQDC